MWILGSGSECKSCVQPSGLTSACSLPYGTKPDYSLVEFDGRGRKGGLGLGLGLGLSAKDRRPGAHVSASARTWRTGKQLDRKKKEHLQLAAKNGKIPLSELSSS